jgi:hypothetical protein
VTFNFRNLTVNTNTETYQKLRAIVDDQTLSDKDKLLRVTDLYDKYCKEVQDQFDDDLKKELKRAGKVKLTSLGDMNTPQLIISGVDGKVSINHGSLLAGLDEKEYQIHAIIYNCGIQLCILLESRVMTDQHPRTGSTTKDITLGHDKG